MINPFCVSIIAYILVFGVFWLRWSALYQTLDIKLITFFLVNALFCIFMMITFKNSMIFKSKKYKNKRNKSKKNNKRITVYLLIGYLINFLYSKEIPILNAVTGSGTYYKEIKMIPTLYPLLTALNVFAIIYIFYEYISFKNKKDLVLSIILTIPMLVNMGRGILIMSIFPCVLMYLASVKKILNWKIILFGIVTIMAFLYSFGYFGNMRDQNKLLSQDERSEIILNLGYATEDFRKSIIPNEYFWSYIYISSPIANLNNYMINKPVGATVKEYFVYNFLPQSIQKKLINTEKLEIYRRMYLVDQTFNVSTTYSIPYLFFGWWGVIFYQIIYWIVFLCGFFIVRKTNYESIYLSLNSVLVALSLFDNMIQLDAIFIPILMCIILSIFGRVKIKFKY